MTNPPDTETPALVGLLEAFFNARLKRSLADLKKTLVAPSDGEDLGDDFVLYAEMMQGAAEEILAMPLNTLFVRLASVEVMGPEPPPDAPDVGVYAATIIVKRGTSENEEGFMIYRFGETYKIGLAMSGALSEDGPPS